MAICRDYCQGYWLIEKYAQSDFELKKLDDQTTPKFE
ncbi:hypothetical protein VSVS12_04056 [Vibrio scophthalmi]|nr:hypothetical protein VSVS12_04056 [Vibrio scophthalmi]